MIYSPAAPITPIDQGDLIEGCPVGIVSELTNPVTAVRPVMDVRRVVVLTQTCDLANDKTSIALVAEVQDADTLVREGLLKVADIKGPLRSGRIWGLYFLPATRRSACRK